MKHHISKKSVRQDAVQTSGEVMGERLRELRQKRGLTQIDLAERMGMPQGRISEIERGLHVPNLDTILRLAAALECKPSAVISVFDTLDLASVLRR